MSHTRCIALSLYVFLLFPGHSFQGQQLPTNRASIMLVHGTPVKLQLAQTLSSAHAHKNDPVDLVVAEDVIVGGFTAVKAGAEAKGSVIAVNGKRPLGMGGNVAIELSSVELTNGSSVRLVARRNFKGKSHAIRMGIEAAIALAVYIPVAPVFLLSRGSNSTALKGTEVTAYTKDDVRIDTSDLPIAQEDVSELREMTQLLPPRVLNKEGREGDMLNLIFLAQESDLQEAFARAGWLKADKFKFQTFWHLLWQRERYTKLPMDTLYVFGRPQDYSYVLPSSRFGMAQRHHLRIWRTNRMVNGIPLWVGAATHDVAIQMVMHKFRFLHRIDPNVDAERDFIAENLSEAHQITREQYIRCADPVFSAQTATGQTYHSDSRLLFLQLNEGAAAMAGAVQIVTKLR